MSAMIRGRVRPGRVPAPSTITCEEPIWRYHRRINGVLWGYHVEKQEWQKLEQTSLNDLLADINMEREKTFLKAIGEDS